MSHYIFMDFFLFDKSMNCYLLSLTIHDNDKLKSVNYSGKYKVVLTSWGTIPLIIFKKSFFFLKLKHNAVNTKISKLFYNFSSLKFNFIIRLRTSVCLCGCLATGTNRCSLHMLRKPFERFLEFLILLASYDEGNVNKIIQSLWIPGTGYTRWFIK